MTLIALRHSGTHLIQPLIRNMTGKTVYVPKGQDALDCIPSPKVVVWIRDPRNTLVSMYRYKNGGREAVPNDERFAKMLNRHKRGVWPVTYMGLWARRWAPNLKRLAAGTLVTRFEDYVSADNLGRIVLVHRLDGFLNGEADSARTNTAIAYAFGTSGTYTGRHSQWREWFGPRSTEVWEAQNGPALLRLMGYE